jgi:hypothetical protein
MQFRISPKTLSECSAEEWQARVDLAAAASAGLDARFL